MKDDLQQRRVSRLFDRLEKELLELSPEQQTAITDCVEYQAMSDDHREERRREERRRELARQRQQRYRDRIAHRRHADSKVNIHLVLSRELVEQIDAKAATIGQPGDLLMLRRSAVVEAALVDSGN